MKAAARAKLLVEGGIIVIPRLGVPSSLNDFRGKMKLELIVCFGKHYFQVDFDFFPKNMKVI
jgi:hypothetical protein